MSLVCFVILLTCGHFCSSFSWNQYDYEEEFVDFTDMGSYNHGFQKNRNTESIPGLQVPDTIEEKQLKITRYDYEDSSHTSLTEGSDENYLDGAVSTKTNPNYRQIDDVGIERNINLKKIEVIETATKYKTNSCTVDQSSSMIFLKRIVSSLLRQMNVRGHIFGPGEAITIDLQAEISHEDFTTLNKFVGAVDGDGANYLRQVDSILSNLIHIVEPPLAPNVLETLKEGLINLFTVFLTPKNVLLFFSIAVVIFMVILLAFKTRYAPTVFHIVTYGFLIIFVLSCVWNFVSMYEDAKSQNYARMMQTRNVPSDCEYDRFGYWDAVKYFFRVQLFKYQDQCEAYHQEVMVEPFYRVFPTEAVSQTFATLIFHPGGYIGTKVGQFFVNASAVFPFWLQPLVLILLFVFVFMGLFRFRVSTPLFSIEPAGYSNGRCQHQEGSNMLSQSQSEQQQQIAEKPAAEVVKVNTRDACVDTSDFEEYIRLTSRRKSDRGEQPEVRELPQTNSPSRFSFLWLGRFSFLFIAISSFCEIIMLILDKSLRQVPFTTDPVNPTVSTYDFAIP